MPNKNYIRGRSLEYRIMKDFKKSGWEVFRSAGSHSLADVVAIRDKEITLIQCKTGNRSMTKAERHEFWKYAVRLGVQAIVAYRPTGKRKINIDMVTCGMAPHWDSSLSRKIA